MALWDLVSHRTGTPAETQTKRLDRLLAFIDRSNIGNAAIDGLKTDLDIATGTKFNIALLVFYIPYILVDIPSNWIVKRIRAGFYLPALITAWGIVSTCVGFTRSFAGLVVTRMLLGLFEGGLLGAIVIYLAMFYRRHQMLYRIGLFYCAAPLSGAFGGFLATGLAKIRYHGYNRWPWIFFSQFLASVFHFFTDELTVTAHSSRRSHHRCLRGDLFFHDAAYTRTGQVSHRGGTRRGDAAYDDRLARCDHGRRRERGEVSMALGENGFASATNHFLFVGLVLSPGPIIRTPTLYTLSGSRSSN
jgi:MFS family permease